MRRWALLVCLGAFGVVVTAASPAYALTRTQADAVALRVFGQIGERAHVYGLPAPLPAGTVISDAGPGPGESWSSVVDGGPAAGETLSATVPTTTLSEPGWLFWDDSLAGANFPHPSRLVLVEDSTGRVAWTKTLAWWPLVDGKPAAFYVHAARPAYRVLAAAASGEGEQGVAATSYMHECMVTLYDATDPRQPANFGGDAEAMRGLAASYKVPAEPATSVEQLNTQTAKLVEKGCTDVVLFIAGHGAPASGPGSTKDPTVFLSSTAAPTPSQPTLRVLEHAFTAADLKGFIAGYRGKANFKLLINSCYAGRFAESLAHEAGVVLVSTASSATEPSYEAIPYGAATYSSGAGASPYVVGLTVALKRLLAGENPTITSDAVSAAQENFGYALSLAADQSAVSQTGEDDAAADGLTHPETDYSPSRGWLSPTAPATSTTVTQTHTSASLAQCVLNDGNSNSAELVLIAQQKKPRVIPAANSLTKTATGVYVLSIAIPVGTPAFGTMTYTPPPGLTLVAFSGYDIIDNKIHPGLTNPFPTTSPQGGIFPLATCGSPNPGSNGGTIEYAGQTVQVPYR